MDEQIAEMTRNFIILSILYGLILGTVWAIGQHFRRKYLFAEEMAASFWELIKMWKKEDPIHFNSVLKKARPEVQETAGKMLDIYG